MATQKPLIEMIPELVQHFDENREYLEFNLRLFKVLEGQVRKEVEASLRREVISWTAYKRVIERIPPVNVVRKATDKLSKVYIEAPNRLTDKKTDQSIMDNIVRMSSLDNVMNDANRVYNAQNAFALEPYVDEGSQKFRVLAAHQFLPYSDHPKDPTKMTVFMKILGNVYPDVSPNFDNEGDDKRDDKTNYEAQLIAVYSDKEIIVMEEGGKLRPDIQVHMRLPMTNPFGKIPFVYGNRSKFELLPAPNQEGFDISVLVPKLLADLNYAAQFMSHSIIWTKNADLEGQEINPDAVVDLGERSDDNGDPEIGTIDPKVDIENILHMIEFEVNAYFSSIGIRVTSTGQLSNGRDSSGISKAIDEGDTSAERKVQIEYFRQIETSLWDLMSVMQNVWASSNITKENRAFSVKFDETFRIKFAEMKPLKTNKQKIEEIELMREQKLMTRKQALRMLNPDFSEKQLDAWIKELKDEEDEDMEKMLSAGISAGPERKNDGTFNEDNQVAQNQDPSERTQKD